MVSSCKTPDTATTLPPTPAFDRSHYPDPKSSKGSGAVMRSPSAVHEVFHHHQRQR
jgi:hypothetical protein